MLTYRLADEWQVLAVFWQFSGSILGRRLAGIWQLRGSAPAGSWQVLVDEMN